MKLQTKSITLPTIAKAYRNGFKAGHGGENSALKQLVSRAKFYFLEYTACCTGGPIKLKLDVRGQEKILLLDPLNRQFRSLYFDIHQNGYEILVARSIDFFLPDDGVFVDAGSNWGYFPLLFASREHFTGQIYAFEPMPGTYEDLKKTMDQADLSDWVETFQMALGSEAGTVHMKKTRHSGLAHISKTDTGLEVKIGTIDSFNWNRLDVMKVDVEGHELPVFQGAEETLESCQPVLIFENGVDEGEGSLKPLEFLESKNYRFLRPDLRDGNLVFHPFSLANRDKQPDYLNIVAVPENQYSKVENSIA